MSFVKVIDNTVVQYPYSLNDLKLDYYYVSFPDEISEQSLNSMNCYTVNEKVKPSATIFDNVVEVTPVKNGEVWETNWQIVPMTSSEISQKKEELKQDVTNKRYVVEVGNTRIANNLYSTDRESQTKYVAVAVEISQSNAETFSITWKTADQQFVSLNAPQMLEVISGVRAHVQNCFNKEAEYYTLIETADNAVLANTDFSAGWPSNN